MHIQADHLRAVLLAAGKQDIRYYLNGVHVNGAHIVGTDGNRCHAVAHGQEFEGAPFTIPRASVEMALKGWKPETIMVTNDRIGNVAFTGVDGVFPDYRRILMAGSALPEMMAGVLDCNPDYVRDALKAIKLVERTTYATLAKVSGGRWCWSTARMQIVVQNLRSLEKYGPMHKLETFL